jgi:hypothetical protein
MDIFCATYRRPTSSDMWTDRVGELVKSLGRYASGELGDVTMLCILLGCLVQILFDIRDPHLRFLVFHLFDYGTRKAYLSSASFKGPVDTGFTYCTRCSFLWKARQSTVEKIVLPTPVLAPYICRVLSRGHRAALATRFIAAKVTSTRGGIKNRASARCGMPDCASEYTRKLPVLPVLTLGKAI